MTQGWQYRLRQARRCGLVATADSLSGHTFGLFQLTAFDGHEARAKTGDAGIILVAGRLIDLSFATELGLQRLHRQTVRLHAAVAATFAHGFVDHSAFGRIRIGVAFAAPAFFRGAGLVIDHGRYARLLPQLALYRIKFAAVADRHAVSPGGTGRVFVRLVGDDDDGPYIFGGQLT